VKSDLKARFGFKSFQLAPLISDGAVFAKSFACTSHPALIATHNPLRPIHETTSCPTDSSIGGAIKSTFASSNAKHAQSISPKPLLTPATGKGNDSTIA
jgi:hypothetical protein